MNKKINIDLLTFKTIFSDYKPFLTPLFTILSCILIFVIFILPQANEFFRSQETVKEEKQKLNTLRNNLQILQSISDQELDSQFDLLSSALPNNKNFESIINALSYSANVSGVILGNFDFAVGSLTDSPKEIQKFPFLEIELNLAGGIEQTSSFLNTLSNTLPISRVTKISVISSGTTVRVAFYYKPFPETKFNEDLKIEPISAEGKNLIGELGSFNNPVNISIPFFTESVASDSAL